MPTFPYLGSNKIRFPDAKRGPWILELHFAMDQNGVVLCVGADLRSFEFTKGGKNVRALGADVEPVDAKVWRSVAIQKEVDSAVWRFIAIDIGNDLARRKRLAPEEPVNEWTSSRLELVANVYKANLGTRAPTKAVAHAWGISHSMAAKLVARARKEGLLGKVTPGRAGGAEASANPRSRRSRSKR